MLNIEEFEKLSGQNISRGEFCGHLLQRLVEATGASAAVIWNCADRPYQVAIQQTNGSDTTLNISQADHERILDKVMSEKRGLLLRPDQKQSNKKNSPLILLSPVGSVANEVIELVVPPGKTNASDEQLMSTLDTAGRLAGKQAESAEHRKPKSISMQQFSDFVHAVHQSLNRTETCSNIANESRLLLDCDRVSVVTRQRGRFRIASISGQPSVNRRSNAVQLLEKLAHRVLKTERQFWYPNDEELPPQLKQVLDTYLIDNATRSLVIKPIFEKKTKLVEDPESNERKSNPVIGGLIFEHCNEQWEPLSIDSALNFVNEHASNALRNSKTHTDMFLYPVWNLLGKSRVLTAPRVLPKTLLVLGALIVASLFLTLYRVPFYVSADGVLVPQHRSRIFAGQNGDVDEIFVGHGNLVTKGQKLLTLQQKELDMQLEETTGRIDVLNKRKSTIENQRLLSTSRQSNQQASEANLESIAAEIKSLQEKSKLLQQLKQDTTIRSPIAGQVITWDVEQKLGGRSVRADQQLLEIADVDGPWILELDVEDRRIGQLLKGFKRSDDRKLEVKFSLAADPDNSYEGTLVDVSNAIQLSKDNSQVVRARVQLAENMIPIRQAKTGVTAKIYCGYDTSIGYLWLYDVKDAFNRYVSFYFAD